MHEYRANDDSWAKDGKVLTEIEDNKTVLEAYQDPIKLYLI